MRRRVAALALALACGGCATQSVTLLPGEDGHPVGAVAVLDEKGDERGVLDQADARAGLGGKGRVKGRTADATKLDRRYGKLVADLPPPAQHFTLSFDIGESAMAPDQEEILQAMLKAVAERPGAEVQVVGHTDTIDTEEVNDRMSRRRAEEVRDYLISRGLKPEQVRATWRGERELLVKTGDQVANAANRRVEVIVR